MEKSQHKYYRTTNFYLAAFIYSKGVPLVNIDKLQDAKRAHFVFADKDHCEELNHLYSFAPEDSDEVLVDVRKVIHAVKELKSKLYGDF